MFDRVQLKQMSIWAGFVGIMTIIGGALSCLSIVGIIPGVISIILGLKLRGAKKYADELMAVEGEETQAAKVNLLLTDLSMYFKIQGILIVVGLVFAVISLIVVFTLGLFATNQFSQMYF